MLLLLKITPGNIDCPLVLCQACAAFYLILTTALSFNSYHSHVLQMGKQGQIGEGTCPRLHSFLGYVRVWAASLY